MSEEDDDDGADNPVANWHRLHVTRRLRDEWLGLRSDMLMILIKAAQRSSDPQVSRFAERLCTQDDMVRALGGRSIDQEIRHEQRKSDSGK